MSAVTFHLNVAQPLVYSYRLLRKASSMGARVMVTGPLPVLQQLDQLLWTCMPQEFLPHCWDVAPALMRQVSPIILVSTPPNAPLAPALLHLGGDLPQALPAALPQFDKIMEVVGTDAQAVQAARQRWQFYKAQGHDMATHDSAKSRAAHD
jgi:DNA polymerase-3 subunit chi